MQLIPKVYAVKSMLIQKMNYGYALKAGFESVTFGRGKYGEFSAAPMVDLTMARVELNKCHVRDLAPVSRETNGARHKKRVLPLLN